MTSERLPRRNEVLSFEWNANRQQILRDTRHVRRRARTRAKALGGKSGVEKIDVVVVLFALHELRRHVADEAMIGMPRSSFRTEGDNGRGLNASDDRAQLGAQASECCERGKPTILQSDEMQL